jgi:hypothetical protein
MYLCTKRKENHNSPWFGVTRIVAEKYGV